MANVSLIVDGDLSSVNEVNRVKEIEKIGEIGRLSAFPEYRQPYNTMIKKDLPAATGSFELVYETNDQPCEILAVTVTCSGYGKDDYFDMYINDRKIFDHWYTSEVKEGLFLGTSTFAYKIPENSKIKVDFFNNGTSKTVWVGLRMLVPDDKNIN
jgi:hypothetical protein